MSETRFTKEPWKQKKSPHQREYSHFILSEARGLDGVNRPCDVAYVAMGGDEKEIAANAALIAAAPDMYEALEKCVDELCVIVPCLEANPCMAIIEQAKNALKKARGE